MMRSFCLISNSKPVSESVNDELSFEIFFGIFKNLISFFIFLTRKKLKKYREGSVLPYRILKLPGDSKTSFEFEIGEKLLNIPKFKIFIFCYLFFRKTAKRGIQSRIKRKFLSESGW